MNDLYEKIKHQWEVVLIGEAHLLQSAAECKVNVEYLEKAINSMLDENIIFGSGDPIRDVMMGAYMIGRKAQFIATMTDLVGQDDLKELLRQVTDELEKSGDSGRKLN